MASKFDVEQARAIRVALENGRTLSAWSAKVSQGGDQRIAIVIAVTARGASALASELGGVVRVGPAHVRDLQGAIDRALARRPEPQGAASVVPPTERERARVYLKGLGERPGDHAVNRELGRAVIRRAAGEPRKGPAVAVPRQPGTPCVGEYTLNAGRRFAA